MFSGEEIFDLRINKNKQEETGHEDDPDGRWKIKSKDPEAGMNFGSLQWHKGGQCKGSFSVLRSIQDISKQCSKTFLEDLAFKARKEKNGRSCIETSRCKVIAKLKTIDFILRKTVS